MKRVSIRPSTDQVAVERRVAVGDFGVRVGDVKRESNRTPQHLNDSFRLLPLLVEGDMGTITSQPGE